MVYVMAVYIVYMTNWLRFNLSMEQFEARRVIHILIPYL